MHLAVDQFHVSAAGQHLTVDLCFMWPLQVSSVFFNCPNLHFLPCNPIGSKFKDDVYIATR